MRCFLRISGPGFQRYTNKIRRYPGSRRQGVFRRILLRADLQEFRAETPLQFLSGRAVKPAVSLYRSGLAPKILMSGGVDKEDNANESEVMKKIAVEAGVPEQIFSGRQINIHIRKHRVFQKGYG
jgi:hypothetical protein